jgi:oligopeptide/dipeptide ABC transporter ATP-binding protein
LFQAAQSALVNVKNLTVRYRTTRGLLTAVEGVDLELRPKQIHALIGESGCGKSTLGLSIPRLLPEEQVVYSGSIMYNGREILSLDEKEMEKYRGTEIASVFQEPMTSLNPVYTVEKQVAEALRVRFRRESNGNGDNAVPESGNEMHSRVLSQLREAQIADPERVARMHPHELSGGMKQRVMIAMAVAERPSCLVADEPTTALDVTTQAQILNLVRSLTLDYGMGTLLITHDLGVVRAVADYASVMYAGEIVEEASSDELFKNPLHPYTQALIDSFPRGGKADYKVKTISGSVPSIQSYPSGCRFHPRCGKVFKPCPTERPRLVEINMGHKVSCFLYGN